MQIYLCLARLKFKKQYPINKIKSNYRFFKRIPALLTRRDYFFRLDCKISDIRFGSEYGGWNVVDKILNSKSIIYSFGIGEDITFDLDFIKKVGANVHAFDPTPKSLEFIKNQILPQQLIIHEYALSDYDGELTLYPPKNSNHVSYSTISKYEMDCGSKFPVRKLSTIMNQLQHDKIDLLKMDIEGAEYDVIENLITSNIKPCQLLIEFHHRFLSFGIEKTKAAISSLKSNGYKIFYVSDTGEEICFIHCDSI